MMSDKEFAELELRATICPGQSRWPAADLRHWQRLHQAANEARARVSNAHMQMDEIDRDADLSPDDKYRKRSMTSAQAIADLEASKTLERATRASVWQGTSFTSRSIFRVKQPKPKMPC
jgi:hypothetical protein